MKRIVFLATASLALITAALTSTSAAADTAEPILIGTQNVNPNNR
ncbi:ABC-type sugar transport system substrate-binding protein [Nonomuraea thailandensis]|uniref:ABC-type sugar transport system substrate-binding protein n=1 Tax=Nonomuraea thailandensis TaxID=1188745 RepID=A0A9X2GH95_9ACTN|nr:hypothetical protein [Nonomuraea thailandensis]MCP2354088.1 ABC-type sugar transport system substrate-binding protein [Nonomuraea thailandensis]